MSKKRGKVIKKPREIVELEIKAKRNVTRLTNQGLGDLSFIGKSLARASQIIGKKMQTFNAPEELSESQWKTYKENLERFNTSHYQTKRGRKRIRSRVFKTFQTEGVMYGDEKQELTRSQSIKLLNFFESGIFKAMQDEWEFTSEEAIELILEDKSSLQDFKANLESAFEVAESVEDFLHLMEYLK